MLCDLQTAIVYLIVLATHAVAEDVDHHISYLARQAIGPRSSAAETWRQHRPLNCCYAHVVQAAADTFQLLPQQLNPAYRNPCWRREGVFQCLPYFQVLGVSKCGTSDLYKRLTRHSQVEDCQWKGPHFWDESRYGNGSRRRQRSVVDVASEGGVKKATKYDGSFGAYVNIFKTAAARIEQAPYHVTGEASSNTFTGVLTYLRGRISAQRLAPGVTLAHYLWEAVPFSRFIVLLRDPVTRYKSAFHYYRDRKKVGPGTPEEFHRQALADMAAWRQCIARSMSSRAGGVPAAASAAAINPAPRGTRSAARTTCAALYHPQQLVKGMYAEFLPVWLSVWPRDRFLFLRTEDYHAATGKHIAAVVAFLGLRNLTSFELAAVSVERRTNSQTGRYQDMLPKTRQLLQNFYRPFNARLAHMLALRDNSSQGGSGVGRGADWWLPDGVALHTNDTRWRWGD